MDQERLLIKQVINGNTGAFRLLIKQYEKLVVNIAGKMIHNKEDLEDLCQDVFVKVYRKLPEFRLDSKLSTWIATISYRTAITYLRKNKYQKSELNDQSVVTDEALIIQENPEDQMSKETLKKYVHKMIEKLPSIYRTVLTLYHLEEFSYKEIGEITGLPDGTVKNYLFRARELLKKKLKFILKERELI
jgi:RNA polymerase sigma factor (sigma-70 family)